jgi:hypothetical protein
MALRPEILPGSIAADMNSLSSCTSRGTANNR